MVTIGREWEQQAEAGPQQERRVDEWRGSCSRASPSSSAPTSLPWTTCRCLPRMASSWCWWDRLAAANRRSFVSSQVSRRSLPAKNRDIAMVFQNYALYPHMTVEQNLGFGLKLRGVPKAEIKRKVMEAARTLAIMPLMGRKPAALSGGQRQRVAMGRAMVREPKAFLMDEPLSNLDAKLRVQMRAELARLRDRLRTTTIYVTHDQVEAMTLGDRVAVLKDGKLQQLATPTELFNHPANLFVAAFIGSPSMNLVEARVADGAVSFGSYSLPLPPGVDLSDHNGGSV